MYNAKAIEIMIASPSDVVSERQIVRDVISEWNSVHSRRESTCLMPTGWETHSSPELSGRPQQLINERILEFADLLVGIFWTRVGSPTGKSISGSVEEIERHLSAGKPVLLYFSTQPVIPSTLDHDQFQALDNFKAWAMKNGLVETYENPEDFRGKFRNHLQITLTSNDHLKNILEDAETDFVSVFENALSDRVALSNDAQCLLKEAANSDALITIRRYMGGSQVSAGHKQFAEPKNPKSIARWVAAAEELEREGFSRDINGRGEIFEITHAGYKHAENLTISPEDG